MPRILIPTHFSPQPASNSGPALVLRNPQNHSLSIHPISPSIVRVVHELPRDRYPQSNNGGINWEEPSPGVTVDAAHNDHIILETDNLLVKVNTSGCPRLEWFAKDSDGRPAPTSFLADSPSRAYSFDAASGGVIHMVERENHLPVSEDEFTTVGPQPFLHDERNEFVYGLGESRGTMEKSGKKFTMEGRDALSYDWENGDPLYKVNPFVLVYNKGTKRWYGIFYNSLVDSSFDMGAESDILFGCFRTYRANSGPLDYYVLIGDGTLPSIISAYASLVSPTPAPNSPFPFAASPTLPPLSQFGYLSSSLSLAADPKAQEAVIDFLETSRKEGFAVDGLYLSSGWCQDEITDDRNYFSWNTSRYPSPAAFGHTVETTLEVQVIVNMKPWLLDVHPLLPGAEAAQAFVRAPEDARGDRERSSEGGSAESLVWSSGFGAHKLGRYFDYSSKAGSKWWQDAIKEHVIANGLTGMWIDNNEMAGLVDDEALFRGEVGMWNASGIASNVEQRMGWGLGETRIGNVGKATQTIGMARATFDAVISARPGHRPVIVSRSGVPGIQAYAHATWSGDNSTTWKALKWGTKMTLSVGLSFGPGLYGHDIGGFAGKHHPSPELLVRWCQNGAWHSRFTVHSWKEVSTTLWMYKSEPGITEILQDVLAFRYRLAPTFYSLYVTDYHRNGWPILKPLLWLHSDDPQTLKLDEEFLFGSHVLVAPVTTKGAVAREVFLPAFTNAGERDLEWCELDTGKWHVGTGDFETFDVPLARTLVLVRAGGILVLGGPCSKNIYDGFYERHVLIFPSASSSAAGSTGTFTLIEDDGRSNDHTTKGIYTELELSFRVVGGGEGDDEVVEVDYRVVKGAWELEYEVLWWELPKGDGRRIVAKGGKETRVDGDGRVGIVVLLHQE